MSSPRRAARHSIVAALIAALAVASLVACAQGTSGSDDDDEPRVDARRVDARPVDARTIDAPGPPIDARPVDAALPIDGSMGGGSCTSDSQCTVQGQCCSPFTMTCVPGMILPPPFNVCVPTDPP